jgi:L-ascorbate metabolism protein UlaG (beta-lactamase superfamily)
MGGMLLRLIRSATLVVDCAGRRLLVDPMLNPAGAVAPVENTANPRRNPLVELPCAAESVVAGLDALLLTHLHNDHFDARAAELVPRHLPVFCQPSDADRLRGHGFEDVRPLETVTGYDGITVDRVGGRHGTGDVGRRMGQVSGFVLRAPGEPVLYVAGDTIWCPEVEAALHEHAPDVVIVNAGGARFLEGGHIVMDERDVITTSRALPTATVVAVHLEALNHCPVTRAGLRAHVEAAGAGDRVRIPADGETLVFQAAPEVRPTG